MCFGAADSRSLGRELKSSSNKDDGIDAGDDRRDLYPGISASITREKRSIHERGDVGGIEGWKIYERVVQ